MAKGELVEVAKAAITIVPTLQGSQAEIASQMNGAASAAGTSAGKTAGQDMLASMGKTMTSAGKTMTGLFTVPLAAIGTASFAAATDFETAFAQLMTIADTSTVAVDDLKDGVKDLSSELGISSSDISAAAYSAISAGQDTADALKFVRSAAKLARGGFTNVATATDVLTTALNAYGLSAEDVTHVSDVLIETQNEGKTTVDELAASMGRVIPTAAAANVGLEDLASQYVALTKNGIGTAEATTYINSMLNELSKSGTTASDMFKEAAGVSFPEYIAAGGSTADAMAILAWSCEQAGLSVNDAFGSAEAGKAANVLVQHASDSTTALDNMRTMAGQTETAYSTMSDTTAVKLEEMKVKLENLAITLGETLIPLITPIIDTITNGITTIVEKWNSLDEGTQQMIIKVATIVAVLGPLLIIGGKLAQGISSITSLFAGLGNGIAGLVGKFTSFGASATTAASGAASAASSFGTLAGTALLLVAAGAAIFMIGEAMSVMADAAIRLSEAGGGAVATFVLIAGVGVGMAAAIVAIGTAAEVSAVGLLALSAAVLAVSAGISLVILSLTLFVEQLPTISEWGLPAAEALLAISAAILAVDAAALLLAVSIAAMGVAAAAAFIPFLGVDLTIAALDLAMVGLDATMAVLTVEMGILEAALLLVAGSLEDIKDDASEAATSLSEITDSVSVIEEGIEAIKGAISSVISFIVDALDGAEPDAVASATALAEGITTAIDTTLNPQVKTDTDKAMTDMTNSLTQEASTARTAATQIGQSIVQGISQGMSALNATLNSAYMQVVNIINSMKYAFASTSFRFNSYIPLPHFYLAGSFDARSGSVPSVGVSWYARAAEQGARFTRPQIIGVGDASQPELLIGEDKLKSLVGGGQPITINVYGNEGMNVRDLADAVAQRLTHVMNSKEAVYA